MKYAILKQTSDLLIGSQVIGNKIFDSQTIEISPERLVYLAANEDISISTADAKVILGAILSKDLLPTIKRYTKMVNHPVFGASKHIKQKEKWKTNKKRSLEELLTGFPFADKITKSRALALMITPFIYIGGITPIAIYLGNRERIGKDYLASITRILANDTAGELPPLKHDEETRKTLLALSLANEEFAHFSNNVGHMNSPSLEQAVTCKTLKGRILGKTEVINVPFKLIVSLSGNAGWSLTPDLTYRSVIVALHSDEEDILNREFVTTPAILAHEKRGEFWNSIKTMYNIWVKKGKPKGSINHATFPEWANIIGGIMEANGYINPLTYTDAGSISSLIDRDGEEWKRLLPILINNYDHLSIKTIMQIAETNELFDFLDFTKHGYRTAFGKLIKKYSGRWFNDYRLVKIGTKLIGTNTGKQLYMVEKKGEQPKICL